MPACDGLERGLEIGEWFDAVDLGGFDQRGDAAPGFSSLVMTRKQGVFSVQCDWADHVLDAVGVDFDAAIGQESFQPFPVAVDIGKFFSEAGLGRDAQPLFLQPLAESADQRNGPLLAGAETLAGRRPADFSFNGVELGDPAQALRRNLGAIAVEHLLQFATCVRPTICHADRVAALAGGARQAVVALIAVDLQGAIKALQDPFCVLTGAAGGVGEDHAGRIGTAPPPIITGQCPEVAGLGPAAPGVEDRRRGFIHEQLGGGLQMLGQPVDHGPEVERGHPDPVGQRAAMDADPRPGEDPALAV